MYAKAYIISRIIIPFRKSFHAPSRKLIPSFTLTHKNSNLTKILIIINTNAVTNDINKWFTLNHNGALLINCVSKHNRSPILQGKTSINNLSFPTLSSKRSYKTFQLCVLQIRCLGSAGRSFEERSPGKRNSEKQFSHPSSCSCALWSCKNYPKAAYGEGPRHQCN